MKNTNSMHVMPVCPINCAVVTWRSCAKHLWAAQNRYKSDSDKKVRSEPTHATGDCLFGSRPPLTTSATEHLTSAGFSNVLAKKHGLYRMMHVRPDYLKILRDGIENSICINRVTRVRQERESLNEPLSKAVEPKAKRCRPVIQLQNRNMEQCAVEPTVRSSVNSEVDVAAHSPQFHNIEAAIRYCTACRRFVVLLENFLVRLNCSKVRTLTAHLSCMNRSSGVLIDCCEIATYAKLYSYTIYFST